MRPKVSGPAPVALAALIAAVLALAGLGLLVAKRGAATDAPLADGDATGHFAQPKALGDEAARAMAAVVRTGTARVPGAPVTHASGTAPLPVSDPLEATGAEPSPAVGPLFYTGQGNTPGHGCTASVVHSAKGDLVVTAAHCVHQDGFRTDIAFAPGYRDGVAPYGVWVPTSVDVAPEWVTNRDPDHDVAFLRVRRAGDSTPVERVTGAERIRFPSATGRTARVIGYPVGSEGPVACQNKTETLSPTQLRFPCRGLPNGTSGAPFLTDIDPATGLGTINGVLGGYEEGGDEETSYSPYLGEAAAKLYRRAAG
ncbi:serine protease [Streptomyces sp. ISL-11]|uniref:trypsin-like serine peptidase n=1 Tax=Streptomyces sp. ISL-11 TaxID=2819174 RepID=UPI001BE6032B|nr:serine protease [Streptomyces sp. ISL-11]MBT2384352.1 trypsin-like peptidase domain-containing protein [Streptomyces sp. ISL-11]